MLEDLAEFAADEPIFIDAHLFLFHAFDDENYGEIATSFLTRVESGEINAVTSALVIDEVLFKILVQEAAAHLKKPTIWLTIRLFAWSLWRIGHRLQGQVFVDG